MDEILREMELKGLAQTGSGWIRRAIIEQPSRISLTLAASAILVYDRLDRLVIQLSRLN